MSAPACASCSAARDALVLRACVLERAEAGALAVYVEAQRHEARARTMLGWAVALCMLSLGAVAGMLL